MRVKEENEKSGLKTQHSKTKIMGREQLPTPVFWPGEFHGLYSPWGCKESDTTERLSLPFHTFTKNGSVM